MIQGVANDGQGKINDGRFSYAWEAWSDPRADVPSQLAVVWWGEESEPDLMVIYNEHWEPFTVNNLHDWSQGDWQILARSWLDSDGDFCSLDRWQEDCPGAGDSTTVQGRSMAILVSDND